LSTGDASIITTKSVAKPNLSTFEHGDQRKSVKFESDGEKYDMRKYLTKNEHLKITPALHQSIDNVNVTTRCKARSSTNEKQLPQSQNGQANRSAIRFEQPRRMKVKLEVMTILPHGSILNLILRRMQSCRGNGGIRRKVSIFLCLYEGWCKGFWGI
jgi:hypothetical protein